MRRRIGQDLDLRRYRLGGWTILAVHSKTQRPQTSVRRHTKQHGGARSPRLESRAPTSPSTALPNWVPHVSFSSPRPPVSPKLAFCFPSLPSRRLGRAERDATRERRALLPPSSSKTLASTAPLMSGPPPPASFSGGAVAAAAAQNPSAAAPSPTPARRAREEGEVSSGADDDEVSARPGSR
jgi:hypothetical protein